MMSEGGGQLGGITLWPGRGLYLDTWPRRSNRSMLRRMFGRRFRAARAAKTASPGSFSSPAAPAPVEAQTTERRSRPPVATAVKASPRSSSGPVLSVAGPAVNGPAVNGAPGREVLIRVQGVEKAFGSVVALRGVDLTVERGTVLGLLGRNGAGKSTLVRILSTLLLPDKGSASIAGVDVVKHAHRVRALIGLAGQAAAVDPMLTGRENLELVGRLYGLSRQEARARAADVLEHLSLTAAADRRVFTYSGGMRRRLDLGASLVGKPLVLIMDEPTAGLDPRTRLDLWRFVDDLVREGTTVLLTTQYLEEADRLADRIAVLERGAVIAAGTADELKQRIGGEVLELRARSGVDVQRLSGLLAGLGSAEPVVDMRWQRLTLPTKDPIKTLLAASRRIQESGIKVEDLGLRRPSLDDVFLTLTGAADTDGRPEPQNGAPQPEQDHLGRAVV
jgi:ABC-2 type transport system ATP-binding protein